MSNRAKQRRIGKRAIQAILQEYTLEELKKMCWEKEEKESAGEWPPMENGVCCDECRDDPCSCKPFCELPQNGDWKRFGGMAKGKPFMEEALKEASDARHEEPPCSACCDKGYASYYGPSRDNNTLHWQDLPCKKCNGKKGVDGIEPICGECWIPRSSCICKKEEKKPENDEEKTEPFWKRKKIESVTVPDGKAIYSKERTNKRAFWPEHVDDEIEERKEDIQAAFRLINQINLNLQKIYSWHDQEIELRRELLDLLALPNFGIMQGEHLPREEVQQRFLNLRQKFL